MSTLTASSAPEQIAPLVFIANLRWLNLRPLIEVFDNYRLRIMQDALYSFDDTGRPQFNLVLAGRGKKNFKTADLIIAALYRMLVWKSATGNNECFILANDKDQAADDLTLAKKLIETNDVLEQAVVIRKDVIERRDSKGFLEILPAQDVRGSHGKTFLFCGFDEIHSYKNYDLLEALALDPSRPDAMWWITSYASLFHKPGIPLFDLMATGKKKSDPRMYFSWYSADFCTDDDYAEATPEQRANPSMALWNNDGYLEQQRARLPSHKYRRLHLNLPGLPEGSAFSFEMIDAAIDRGVRVRPYQAGIQYVGFCDMSGGSNDDAVLGIAHLDINGRAILDRFINQGPPPPFDPRTAIEKFADVLAEYRISAVTGDRYAGETFRADFRRHGIEYVVSELSASQLYEQLEPRMNAGDARLLDHPTMESQLLGLIWRGNRIDHPGGEHDDWSNAAAGAIYGAFSGVRASVADIATVTSKEQEELNRFLTGDDLFHAELF
jgi:hypothetical protein